MKNTQLVWALTISETDKTYHISLELRDYDKNYLSMIPLNKEFITNLISKMAVSEEKGYIYKCPVPMHYQSEGLK